MYSHLASAALLDIYVALLDISAALLDIYVALLDISAALHDISAARLDKTTDLLDISTVLFGTFYSFARYTYLHTALLDISAAVM
jgi:hypothetical protein